MTAVYIILGIIAFLIVIQLLPVTFHIRYRGELFVRLRHPVYLISAKKKEKIRRNV